MDETLKQKTAVDNLAHKGWRVDTVGEDGTIYLSKRGKFRWQTLYCEVDRDGNIDGHKGD